MGSEFFLFYAEANVVCILLFGILLVNDRIGMYRQEKQIIFDRALMAHILYFISDVFWAGVISGVLPRTRLSVALLNYTNFVLLSAIAYEWAKFAAVSVRMPFRSTKHRRLHFRLPFVVMCLVMLGAYLADPYYWVNAAGELNTLYYPMMLTAPLIYLSFSCVQSLKMARKTEDPTERKQFRTIGLYPLEVVFFGVIQLTFINAPLFCFGCTVMMLFFYIRAMNDQISLDPLTKINNRSQMLRYAAQENSRHREYGKTFVVMVDANDFKGINDNHGHAEGDRALVLIADALRSCVSTLGSSYCLCRYGGDEFALIVHADRASEVEHLLARVRSTLAETGGAEQLPYQLSISAGCAEWNVGAESLQDSMKRADAALYEDKKHKNESTPAT